MKNVSNKAREIFERVLFNDNTGETSNILQLSNNDQSLAAEVEALLEAYRAADSILDAPLGLTDLENSSIRFKRGDRIQRYQIKRLVGSGGFGQVFESEQSEPIKRKVAIKFVRPGYGSNEVLQRFQIERQTLASLNHPNIAKVLDVGSTDSGQPFFVMDMVEGGNVSEFCDQKDLSIRDRVELIIETCKAIHHAHQKGIIHRDLKPSNILIEIVDGKPHPKIIDFGISKVLDNSESDSQASLTRERSVIGTPSYMSPEQSIRRNDIDTRSDIYSIGSILYHLLVGHSPHDFESRKDNDLLEIQRVLSQDVAKPLGEALRVNKDLESVARKRATSGRKLRQIVCGDLDCIVSKAIAKDRERRYSSAIELADDLERWKIGAPIDARPPSFLYKSQRLFFQHRTIVISLAIIVTTLIAATIFSYFKAEEARAMAIKAEQKSAEASQNAKSLAKAIGMVLDILGMPDPRGSGQNINYEEVSVLGLDRWSELEGKDPILDFKFYACVGGLLFDLEFFETAIEPLEKAINILVQNENLNGSYGDLLLLKSRLALAHSRTLNYDQASELSAELISELTKPNEEPEKETPGDLAPKERQKEQMALFAAYMTRARLAYYDRSQDEAVGYTSKAMKIAEQRNSTRLKIKALKEKSLAVSLNDAEQSTMIAEEIYEMAEGFFGESSYDALIIHHFLGKRLMNSRNPADQKKALEIFRGDLPKLGKILVPNHDLILRTMLCEANLVRESDTPHAISTLAKIDSLLEESKTPRRITKYQYYLVKGAVYRAAFDYEVVLLCEEETNRLARELFDEQSVELLDSLYRLAWAHYAVFDYDNAILLYEKGLEISNTNPVLKAKYNWNDHLAIIHTSLEQYDEAERFGIQSAKFHKTALSNHLKQHNSPLSTKQIEPLLRTNRRLALSYLMLKKHKRGLELLEKSLHRNPKDEQVKWQTAANYCLKAGLLDESKRFLKELESNKDISFDVISRHLEAELLMQEPAETQDDDLANNALNNLISVFHKIEDIPFENPLELSFEDRMNQYSLSKRLLRKRLRVVKIVIRVCEHWKIGDAAQWKRKLDELTAQFESY